MNEIAVLIVFWAAFTLCGLVWLAYSHGRKKERKWWQDEMIRRRHAVFHWENGKWYWNEDEPPTPRDPAATKIAKNGPKILGRVETSF